MKVRGGQTVLALGRHLPNGCGQPSGSKPLWTFQKGPAWRLPGVWPPRSILTCVCVCACTCAYPGPRSHSEGPWKTGEVGPWVEPDQHSSLGAEGNTEKISRPPAPAKVTRKSLFSGRGVSRGRPARRFFRTQLPGPAVEGCFLPGAQTPSKDTFRPHPRAPPSLPFISLIKLDD